MQHVLIIIYFILSINKASLVAQMVKNPPAMWETWVQSLDWKDPLDQGMATTPVFLSGDSHGQRSLATVHRITKIQT